MAGVCSAVPSTRVDNRAPHPAISPEDLQKIIKTTGIEARRVAPDGMCTSDLCLAAAERLLQDVGWARDSVDTLIFISQSGDYLLPATACLLQQRLGLPKTCNALDINLGCSGYAYGLWVASGLIASGASKRLLLLVGEISTRRANTLDRSVSLLFGDAGTATALEASPGAAPWSFTLGTDGSGAEHLVIPAGGCRVLPSERTLALQDAGDGSKRSLGDVAMNGVEVFVFTTREVPPLVRTALAESSLTVENVDAVVFHQANEFMLKHVAKSLKLPWTKVPLTLKEFGNTSSATIPLTLTEGLGPQLRERSLKLVLAGFGVGLSWGAVSGEFGPMTVSPLVEVGPEAIQQPLTGGLAL